MNKFFLRFFIIVLIVVVSTIIFLSYFGIETNKFDGLIKSKANEVNRYVKLGFQKTKIYLNPTELNLVVRLQNPKTATLLFSSGKMVCTGAKSQELAETAVSNVVKILRKGKVKIKKDAIVSIQNIVSSINLGGKVNLEQAARTLPRSMYEPEQFPGLIHRMLDPKTVILIFASGKLVCVGAKLETEVYRSVNNVHALLEEKDLMVYE